MTTLTIHTYPGNYRVHKALIAAQYNNIKINVPAGFEIDKDNQTKEFESKFPVKKVPAMDTPFGPLAESGAILRYIARLRPDTGLLGSSFYLQALVDQWIDYCGFEIEPSRATWLYPIWKIHEFNQKAYEASKEEIHKSLRLIDSHLATRTYLVGNQITLADIVVVTAFADLVKLVLTEADAKKYINFTRWFNTCVNQPQFAAVLGAVEFAKSETRANAGGEKKEEKAGSEKKEKEAGEQQQQEDPERGQQQQAGQLQDSMNRPSLWVVLALVLACATAAEALSPSQSLPPTDTIWAFLLGYLLLSWLKTQISLPRDVGLLAIVHVFITYFSVALNALRNPTEAAEHIWTLLSPSLVFQYLPYFAVIYLCRLPPQRKAADPGKQDQRNLVRKYVEGAVQRYSDAVRDYFSSSPRNIAENNSETAEGKRNTSRQ